MKYLYMLILICFAAVIDSCQNSKGNAVSDRMSVKFEWSPTAGSAEFC
jgi:hypothetical protein